MKNIFVFCVMFITSFTFVSFVFGHNGEASVPVEMIQIQQDSTNTHHIEVKPETLEGQRIPNMNITVTVISKKDGTIVELPLHPMFGGGFHYGANIALSDEEYVLEFDLNPPTFMRDGQRKSQWNTPLNFKFAFNAKEEFDHAIVLGEKTTNDMKIEFEVEHAEDMWMTKDHADEDATLLKSSVKEIKKSSLAIFWLLGGIALGFFIGKMKKVK